MKTRNLLMIAASDSDADMLYASGIFVPDAFIAVRINNQWHGLFSSLEVDRARKESRFEHIHFDQAFRQQAPCPGIIGTAIAFLQQHQIQSIHVASHFPSLYTEQLRQQGIQVNIEETALFPQRELKNEWEIKQLTRAERLTGQAMQKARQFLAQCSIDNQSYLRHPEHKTRVQSKHLRAVIEGFLIQHGAIPAPTIVACGAQSADPHQIGHGPLRAHQSIIVDIFPRLSDCGYWGDMTRTFVKGKAPKILKKMHQSVREGQEIGLNMVANGVSADSIHTAIQQYFTACGFPTTTRKGKQVGFFHGTGHGVGLDIHEAPRVSANSAPLKTGQVITIEPGLYDPEIGGVRIEDMVLVQEYGCLNLAKPPKGLEIA